MNINIDGLMGFYIVSAIMILAIVQVAFIASWNEKNEKKNKRTTTS